MRVKEEMCTESPGLSPEPLTTPTVKRVKREVPRETASQPNCLKEEEKDDEMNIAKVATVMPASACEDSVLGEDGVLHGDLVQLRVSPGRHVRLHLPLMLTEKHWRRFGLSADDVLHILEWYDKYNRRMLFKMALLYNIVPSATGMKAPYASSNAPLFESRYNMAASIRDEVECLPVCTSRFDPSIAGTTPIPVLRVEAHQYQSARMLLQAEPWDPCEVLELPNAWTFRDIEMVPLKAQSREREEPVLHMYRVILQTVVHQSGWRSECEILGLPEARVAGNMYYIMLERCILVP